MDTKLSALQFVSRQLARLFVRYPKTCILAIVVYFISPIDLVPEAVLGPFGYIDDIFVMLLPFLLRDTIREIKSQKKTGSSLGPDVYDTTAR